MYKVFIGNKTIHFVENINIRALPEKAYHLHVKKAGELLTEYQALKSNNTKAQLYVTCDCPVNKMFTAFRSMFKYIEAAGGLVLNEKGKVLLIYRMGKWDLPKGKMHKGETFEECAIREVEEETGVKGLEITRELITTYHTFSRKGTERLKKTVWYEMKTSYTGELTPQLNEEITKVSWKKKKLKEALQNTYSSIHEVFDAFYKIP